LVLMVFGIYKVLWIVVEHIRCIVGIMHMLKVVIRSIPYIVGISVSRIAGI
jgi:hypothetical protein